VVTACQRLRLEPGTQGLSGQEKLAQLCISMNRLSSVWVSAQVGETRFDAWLWLFHPHRIIEVGVSPNVKRSLGTSWE
jgi:hypothetical protein